MGNWLKPAASNLGAHNRGHARSSMQLPRLSRPATRSARSILPPWFLRPAPLSDTSKTMKNISIATVKSYKKETYRRNTWAWGHIFPLQFRTIPPASCLGATKRSNKQAAVGKAHAFTVGMLQIAQDFDFSLYCHKVLVLQFILVHDLNCNFVLKKKKTGNT